MLWSIQIALPGRFPNLPWFPFIFDSSVFWSLSLEERMAMDTGNVNHEKQTSPSFPFVLEHISILICPVCNSSLYISPESSFSIQKAWMCGIRHATAPLLLQQELPNFSFLGIREFIFSSTENSLDTSRNWRKLKSGLFFPSTSLSTVGRKYWEPHTKDNTTEVFLLSQM